MWLAKQRRARRPVQLDRVEVELDQAGLEGRGGAARPRPAVAACQTRPDGRSLHRTRVFGSNSVPALDSTSVSAAAAGRRRWPAAATWLPVVLLGAGALLGVALWAKWGFAVAFEAIRTYCF